MQYEVHKVIMAFVLSSSQAEKQIKQAQTTTHARHIITHILSHLPPAVRTASLP